MPSHVSAAPAVSAVRLHQAEPTTPTILAQPKSIRPRADWSAWLWSLLLALGFTSTFLLPTLRHGNSPTNTTGSVLGETVIVPLQVSVATITPATSVTVQVQPKTGTIADALARAATKMATQFDYTSRGNSIYLRSFDHLTSGPNGQWQVTLNGQPLTDLTATFLSQGDQLLLTWQPL